MNPRHLAQKAVFLLRVKFNFLPFWRGLWWKMQGAQIGKNTPLPPLEMNWPHQLRLGDNCRLEPRISFKFDASWQPGRSILIGNRVFLGRDCEFNICERITIGDDCLIASGCRFIDHNHGIALNEPMNVQFGVNAPILIEEDVWLGVNVVVLKGVHIGRGAIIGAGAVVTKNVGEREIWAGVPARKIGMRN